jgi:hypothetical protein
MKKNVAVVVVSVVASWIPLALFVLLLRPLPNIAPGLFWTVPLGLSVGVTILWRAYPRDVYPITLVYVPIIGAMLVWAAMRVSWYIVGDYL